MKIVITTEIEPADEDHPLSLSDIRTWFEEAVDDIAFNEVVGSEGRKEFTFLDPRVEVSHG